MNQAQAYKRYPAVKCWIHQILEGKYSNQEKSLYTVFGLLKRVRIIATIIEKREILNNPSDEEDLFEDAEESNIRIEFDLDDGTGLFRGTLWRVDPEDHKDFVKGDIVDVIGLIKYWEGFKSISPEIIKKIEEPNSILLRDAEIIKRLQSEGKHEIPEGDESELELDVLDEEIDVDMLYEDNSNEVLDMKEKIFSLIENKSLEGDGITFRELENLLKVSKDELRDHLRDLEMESRVYQSEEDVYQTF
ncbi:MAG: hypothetical protein GF317_17760 [Candidatus Lokiarchaeota archaeon]|nr:hypothetical protein [Candidatus Lokiarchaeota archaeon]MBD3201359.1 hypothetical protein [Candidatus Lokiarchaeota archaeon]